MDAKTTFSYNVADWINPLESLLEGELQKADYDGSHDMSHFQRVSLLARKFAREENGNELITYLAAMLHDLVSLPKNHPDSKFSSFLAAEKAKLLLTKFNFPDSFIENVAHAIHAHSFSSQIEATTIEAKCLQDADRMEALGAIGLIRVFYVCGKMGSKIMDEKDPEGFNRSFNDKENALDHFPLKLFTLESTMKTAIGRKIAHSLTLFLKNFRENIIQDHVKGKRDLSSYFYLAEHFYKAGQVKLPLFDLQDAFAKIRSPMSEKFALDGLLDNGDPYIRAFIRQLHFELDGYSLIN